MYRVINGDSLEAVVAEFKGSATPAEMVARWVAYMDLLHDGNPDQVDK